MSNPEGTTTSSETQAPSNSDDDEDSDVMNAVLNEGVEAHTPSTPQCAKRSSKERTPLVPSATFKSGERRATISVNDLAKDPDAYRPLKKQRTRKSLPAPKPPTPTTKTKGRERDASAPSLVATRVMCATSTKATTHIVPPTAAAPNASGRTRATSGKPTPKKSAPGLGAKILKAAQESSPQVAHRRKLVSPKHLEELTPLTTPSVLVFGGSPGPTIALASMAKIKAPMPRHRSVMTPSPPPPQDLVPVAAWAGASAAKDALRHAKQLLDEGCITADDYNTMKYQCMHRICGGVENRAFRVRRGGGPEGASEQGERCARGARDGDKRTLRVFSSIKANLCV